MPSPFHAVNRAFDEARFGDSRTLNLRASLPTGEQAAERAERWLREKQASRISEVLIITGRGNQSVDGVAVVREAVRKRLALLKRRGVVSMVQEHTPGSVIVTLAALSALRNAPRRRRDPAPPPIAKSQVLADLSPCVMALLRSVAEQALQNVGVRHTAPFLEDEMLVQFSHVAAAVPAGPNRDARLCDALAALLDEQDER
ncbi:MAG: Smr/MutS family protein [Gemmatimonadaceae bacterium]